MRRPAGSLPVDGPVDAARQPPGGWRDRPFARRAVPIPRRQEGPRARAASIRDTACSACRERRWSVCSQSRAQGRGAAPSAGTPRRGSSCRSNHSVTPGSIARAASRPGGSARTTASHGRRTSLAPGRERRRRPTAQASRRWMYSTDTSGRVYQLSFIRRPMKRWTTGRRGRAIEPPAVAASREVLVALKIRACRSEGDRASRSAVEERVVPRCGGAHLPLAEVDGGTMLARQQDEPVRIEPIHRVAKHPQGGLDHRPVSPRHPPPFDQVDSSGRVPVPGRVAGCRVMVHDDRCVRAQVEDPAVPALRRGGGPCGSAGDRRSGAAPDAARAT